ncbi:hypothetical protein predicted by Glimmer/Critica [Sorangium cellulosum So ce56]|uniref:Leucine-binding protein domain-containing protein n=1 Tax=Sorangium cellulosum (strain So ce56) TaxID=448385 RepID=A9FSZ6_SORC5|nr:hypothetical protein [Sorangium cellulosum]CAN98476.1 hypothetical protein predicted by Glimmer/Critica [Sorangium cellulosum So ce56]
MAAIAAAALLALAAATAGAGCGAQDGGAPQVSPALAGSPAAQAELRPLLSRFANGARAERVALEPELLAFRGRHASDDLARVATVHLAWIALERGDLRRAEALAAEVEAAGRSAVGDLARVIRGAALRRAGKPRPAFGVLRPLVSKMVDAYVRALLNEEVTAAAMEAGAWTQAIELMSVWLREADDDRRAAVRAQIGAQLREVPIDHLVRALRDGRATGEVVSPEVDLRSLVAERLAIVARERRDVALAKELLDRADAALGTQRDAIFELAAGAGAARVEPPTVGLLLSTRTAASRRRGVEIATGVAHGLGLLRPGSDARLVSRDDGGEGSVDEALSSLTAEGAAVLIAGSDREQATEAAKFARTHAIPVLLVHPPEPAALDGAFVFVVGEEPARSIEVLAAALAERGAKPVALVGGDADVQKDAAPATAGAAGAATAGATGAAPAGAAGAAGAAPLAEHGIALALPCDGTFDARALRPPAIRGVVLAGDARCADQALRAAPRSVTIALAFEAAVAPPPGSLVATAGIFPLLAAPSGALPPQGAGDPRATPASGAAAALAAWLATHPSPPSFWAALGRDAGVLAWAGVQRLPKTGTEDPAEVKARRLAAASAMSTATAELWTTAAGGFGGRRVLPRVIGYRESGKAR